MCANLEWNKTCGKNIKLPILYNGKPRWGGVGVPHVKMRQHFETENKEDKSLHKPEPVIHDLLGL